MLFSELYEIMQIKLLSQLLEEEGQSPLTILLDLPLIQDK